MKATMFTLALLAATSVMANELPPIPDGGLIAISSGKCTDNETKEKGFCVISADKNGNLYLIFAQDGDVQFIRKLVDDGYETVYERDGFATY